MRQRESSTDPHSASPGPGAAGAPGPVRLSEGGPTLFIVHDDDGSVEYADDLARGLGGAASVVALPAPGAGEPVLRTIEGMAVRLVRMIRAVQPLGPYRTAGAGVGGLLAHESALLLLGQDEGVEFVGVLDPPPAPSRPAPAARDTLRRAAAGYFPQPSPVAVSSFVAEGASPTHAERWPSRTQLRRVPVSGGAAALAEALAGELRRIPGSAGARAGHGYSPLIPLKSSAAAGASLFCIPGAGASVVSFGELASSLGPHWRVYGLEPRGLDGTMVPHTTVEAAAGFYLQAMRAEEPAGPVHLLGHSFGGWVALEMAQRLLREGRPAASLTVVDSSVPGGGPAEPREYTADEAFLALVAVLELAAERDFGITAVEIAGLDPAGRLKLLHGALVRFGIVPPRAQPGMLEGPFRAFCACLRTSFHPGEVYPEPARLVLVNDAHADEAQNQRRFLAAMQGWKRWVPGLQPTLGSGNHMTTLKRPNVELLASLLPAGASRAG